jgi:glycosyltransferase involved in cell wall biosynthesis
MRVYLRRRDRQLRQNFMSQLRILFVSRSLPFHHIGGMESVAWDLARALTRRGHQVEVLTTAVEGLPPLSTVEGVTVRTVEAPSGRYSNIFWRDTVCLFRDEYADKIDVVLSIGAGAYGIANVRRRGDKPALVMQSHGQAWGELISKLRVPNPISWLKTIKNVQGFFMDRMLRRFDAVIAIGPAVESVLRARPTRWMLGATPVFVVPNGVDEDHFAFNPRFRDETRQRLGLAASARVLISASRLHVQKGVKETLGAFALARAFVPELHYIIAGSGPEEGNLRSAVAAYELQDYVHFAGAVAREDLPRWLSAADVFAFTSHRREGLALGPLEAAASGLPCIISRHLAVPGMDTNLVDARNVSAVAEAIARSFKTLPPKRGSLLPRRYTLEVATETYEKLLLELSARHRQINP